MSSIKTNIKNTSIRLDNKGFTTLELLVVAVIMIALLIMVATNFRGFEHKSTLDMEADKLASIIRQAQIYALTGQTYAGQRYYYGVNLQTCTSGSCTYILFGDNTGSGNLRRYDVGEEGSGGSTHQLVPGVYIDSLLPVDGNNLDIVFEAPLGDIYFNAAQPDTAQIILKHTAFDGQKIITVNRVSGQINIQ